jgi:hypothetical protein
MRWQFAWRGRNGTGRRPSYTDRSAHICGRNVCNNWPYSARRWLEARYELAAFIAANPNKLYFNDTLR